MQCNNGEIYFSCNSFQQFLFFFFANAALITHIVCMFVVFEKKASVIFLGFYFGIAVFPRHSKLFLSGYALCRTEYLNILNIFFLGLPLPLEPQQMEEPPSNLPTSPATVVCSRHRHRWMR